MSSSTAAPAAAASPTKPAKTPEQIAYSKYIGPRTEAHVRNLGIILAAVTAAFAVWHGLTLLEERYEKRRLERGAASRTPALLRGKRALSAAVRKYFTYLTIHLPPLFTITPTELLLFTLYLLTTLLLTLTEAPRAPAKAPGAKRNYGWSSRAGWITLATYPWLVALGMKHNPISYLTGASYERLQKLHRLCSRGTLLIMLMHVAAKVWLKNTFDEGWRAWGLAGTIFGCLIFVLGNKWVFRAAYQFFVYSHVLLVAWLFVATWYHVVDLDGTNEEFKPYLISSIILWLLDRALRLFNVLWINGLIPFLAKKKPAASSSTPASVTVYNDRLMRLEVPQPASMPRWEPGAHVYLMAPPKKGGVSLIYESHPFTIANLHAREDVSAGKHQRDGDATTVATLQQHPSAGSSPSSTPMTEKDSASAHNEKSHPSSSTTSSSTMSFLIRPQQGFTGRLFSHAKRGADIDVRVATAPLSAPRLHNAVAGFDTMVLCAAGVGVSWTVPLLLDAVRRSASAMAAEGKGKGGLRRIVFLWTVQQRSELAVIREEIAEALRLAAAGSQGGLQVEVRVHVTREQVTDEDLPAEWRSAAASNESEKASSSSNAMASIHTYRPDVHSLLSSVVGEAQGRVWVGVCGPYEFGCDVKGAARRCIRPMEVLKGGAGEDGRGDVVVHAEVFGW